MTRRCRIVTLLTDFGTQDAFVASMKGVILSIEPSARFVDISHDVPPRDIPRAARLLATVAPCFPPRTVHLTVVDPGVGTARLPLIVDTGNARFVGPDNGVLMPAARAMGNPRAFAVERGTLPTPSTTFHGRDVFAPVAARLAKGRAPEWFGPPVAVPVEPRMPVARAARGRIEGEVAFVDRFGNLVTNIAADLIRGPHARTTVRIGRRTIRGIRTTYGDVRTGQILALIESTGHLEIAVRDGNAAARLGALRGSRVAVVAGGVG